MHWLIHWYVNDYVDFSHEQKQAFDSEFTSLLAWHRNEELLLYKQDLLALKQDINRDSVSKTQIQQYVTIGQNHMHRLRNKVSLQMADIAESLTDEQVIDLFDALEKENKKREKKITKERKKGPLGAVESRIADITKELESEFGKLTHEQQQIVSQFAPKFNATGVMWIEYRRALQSAAKTLFKNKQTNPNFTQDLVYLIQHPEEYRTKEYASARDANKRTFIELLAQLAPTTTDKQNRKVNKRIDEIVEDIDALIARG